MKRGRDECYCVPRARHRTRLSLSRWFTYIFKTSDFHDRLLKKKKEGSSEEMNNEEKKRERENNGEKQVYKCFEIFYKKKGDNMIHGIRDNIQGARFIIAFEKINCGFDIRPYVVSIETKVREILNSPFLSRLS